MVEPSSNPPYFDLLFALLAAGDPLTVAAFGRHVHWGYWSDPAQAAGTAEDYGQAAERLCRVVCDRAAIRDGLSILDVGCGFGGTLASLNERYSRLALVGVNIDPRQLARAAQQVRPSRGSTLELVEADAARIPLASGSFDVVLAVECVFHFDRRAFFAEAARVLRPGGNLTLSDFVPSARAVEYIEAFDLSSDPAIRWSYGKIDLACSVDRYRELARENGLALAEETDITTHTLPTYDFLNQSVADWSDPHQIAMFRRATGLLEKASRRGWLGYKILRFEKGL